MIIEVNSRSFDRTIRKSWRCELVERRDELIIGLGVFDKSVDHPDLGHVKKGTISYEYFWLDRWYNIFRFHEPTGELRNYYGNICLPPTLANRVLDYVDLDIDVLVAADSEPIVLDRDEYELNAEAFGYAAEVHEGVERALEELLELFARREVPGVPELFCNLPVASA